MLSDILKRIAASAPGAELLFGTVGSASPLTVTVDSRFTLPEEALLIPEGLEKLTLRVAHDKGEASVTEEFILQPGLQAGDKVILTAMGGQYLILDRIGTPGRERMVQKGAGDGN